MTKPEQQPRSRGAERAKQARAQSDQESVQPGPLCKGTNKTAEEQLKKINLAYSILKLSYQNYTKLDEK